jgi:hypothetical protein
MSGDEYALYQVSLHDHTSGRDKEKLGLYLKNMSMSPHASNNMTPIVRVSKKFHP